MFATYYQEANYQRLFKRHIFEYWDSSLIQVVMLLPFLSSLFHPRTKQKHLFYVYFQVSTSECCTWVPVEFGSVLGEESPYVWESFALCSTIGPRMLDLNKGVAAKWRLFPVVYTIGSTLGENRTNIWFNSKGTNHHKVIKNLTSKKPTQLNNKWGKGESQWSQERRKRLWCKVAKPWHSSTRAIPLTYFSWRRRDAAHLI